VAGLLAKETAQRIFRATLAAINIPETMECKLDSNASAICVNGERIDLRNFQEIVPIAYGKASLAMADGIDRIISPELRARGILVAPSTPTRPPRNWDFFLGGHPIPNEQSFAAGRAILERLRRTTDRSLILFLLSGGGSSLVEMPLDPGVSLAEFQVLHRALITCGAPIEEINVIRRHLSATKGGRLAQVAARGATKITLGVTDVPEGHEAALGSGPTLPDPSTIADALRIARNYKLIERLPASLRASFEKNVLVESPKPGDPAFDRAHFMMILGMHDLFHHAHQVIEAHGFLCICDNSTDNWPIDRAADFLLDQLEKFQREQQGRPVAVIADGEISSPVTGSGLGGRNAAFVLACAKKIAGKNITVLSAGTDGIDGNSPAAGAIADGETLARARAQNLNPDDYYARSDAFTFFDKLNDAIVTGPTGNNLRDLRILLT
jgi:glycerate 2-kinase